MSGYTKEAILAKLKDLKIDCKTIDHVPVMTCEAHTEAFEKVGLSVEGQAKNLFFKVPSSGGKMKNRLFLITALIDTKVDPKVVSTRLGIKASAALRFANENIFAETLQVPLGSVTPFCMANETAKEIVMLIDQKFKECSQLIFHPMKNDASSILTPNQFQIFIDATCADRVRWVDFSSEEAIEVPEVGDAAAAPAAAPKEKPKQAAKKKEEPKKTDHAHHAPKQQLFAEDHYFSLQAWAEGPFAKAHEEWLKTQ